MDAEQKEKQLNDAEGVADKVQVGDLDIVSPEPEEFKLGDRTYEIGPLPIIKQRLLLKLAKLEDMKNREDVTPDELDKALDQVVDTISKILEEPDKNFIEEHLTTPKISELHLRINRVSAKGLPGLMQASKKKPASAEA